jgi:hypothetical protein
MVRLRGGPSGSVVHPITPGHAPSPGCGLSAAAGGVQVSRGLLHGDDSHGDDSYRAWHADCADPSVRAPTSPTRAWTRAPSPGCGLSAMVA